MKKILCCLRLSMSCVSIATMYLCVFLLVNRESICHLYVHLQRFLKSDEREEEEIERIVLLCVLFLMMKMTVAFSLTPSL